MKFVPFACDLFVVEVQSPAISTELFPDGSKYFTVLMEARVKISVKFTIFPFDFSVITFTFQVFQMLLVS